MYLLTFGSHGPSRLFVSRLIQDNELSFISLDLSCLSAFMCSLAARVSGLAGAENIPVRIREHFENQFQYTAARRT